MFKEDSRTYCIVPAVQVVDGEFIAGHVIEQYNPNGSLATKYFSSLTKPKILDKIKDMNGFKTKNEQIIDNLLEGIE